MFYSGSKFLLTLLIPLRGVKVVFFSGIFYLSNSQSKISTNVSFLPPAATNDWRTQGAEMIEMRGIYYPLIPGQSENQLLIGYHHGVQGLNLM
uniref:Uncharacterized protein n=1 Tax=Anguilla anguilla TaxID=7936 RepID=A0A0E9X234_ANGAN